MQKVMWFSSFGMTHPTFRSGQSVSQDWISLFDGHSLNGWKLGDNAGTFSVKDGQIMVHGPRARFLSGGTFASQRHDLKSEVHLKQ
jgi:hypothetical protein